MYIIILFIYCWYIYSYPWWYFVVILIVPLLSLKRIKLEPFILSNFSLEVITSSKRLRSLPVDEIANSFLQIQIPPEWKVEKSSKFVIFSSTVCLMIRKKNEFCKSKSPIEPLMPSQGKIVNWQVCKYYYELCKLLIFKSMTNT